MQAIEEWYKELPPITKGYSTLTFLVAFASAVDLVSPYSLYFNASLVLSRHQFWRLLTNFFFFGPFGLDFVFHMFFMVRYMRLLEEQFFRMKPADFLYMLFFGGSLMLLVAPFASMHFLGPSLTFMIVYVWSRRNRDANMNFLGFMHFRAPFLAWVLLGFTLMMGNFGAVMTDAVGMGVGHLYFYLKDIFPNPPGRTRPDVLKTPRFLEVVFDRLQHIALHRGAAGADAGDDDVFTVPPLGADAAGAAAAPEQPQPPQAAVGADDAQPRGGM